MSNHTHTELFTIRDWLRFAVSRFEEAGLFYGHGTQNSFDEAVWLVMATLHLPHDTLENFLDAVITEPERRELLHLIERRVTERIPTAYLVREAWLGEYKFYVDERVIVPRSFIAEMLHEQLAPWVTDPETVVSAADICTGSGCLAILLAHAFPNAEVDAVDISDDALAVAHRNISDYGLQDRVQALQSDMLTALAGKRYNVIISNPPYVNEESMEALPPEYRREPQLALASGDDGLEHVRILLEEAPGHLHRGGLLIVEIGHNRDALEAAFPQLPFTWLEASAGDQFVFMLTREQLPA
ncbi:MAG TPA: 50S ribosomal protein L3 N(5)-glutamine methyltransferase [Novimethylophilus sp.]|jgi:ribosomal protein L3 glutamine methyltransferase|uniref:50S ribosomal protein L3 N(5)-glutamine methyltransferase n=1 Tax=Novimethylophilus sp. TaxID=2137426 RepID=UPI002F40EE29